MPRSALLGLLLLTVLPLRAAPPLRILFVGNSLTYTNDLPAMVVRIGKLDDRRLEIRTLAAPNYSLEDHLGSSSFRKQLRENWDFVVLQQGPSSLPESRAQLIRDVKAIATLLRDPSRAKLAMLMVWPPRERAQWWGQVSDSYRLAAAEVHGLLIPAGTALRIAQQEDPTLPLLGEDGFHPAPAGTYLAALATYHTLIGHLPETCAEPAVAREIAGSSLPLTRQQLQALVRIGAK